MYPLLMYTCGCVGVGLLMYAIFNPYLSFIPKTDCERWETREKSYGHPYYYQLRYDPNQYVHHPDVYNRRLLQRCYPRNIMYLE